MTRPPAVSYSRARAGSYARPFFGTRVPIKLALGEDDLTLRGIRLVADDPRPSGRRTSSGNGAGQWSSLSHAEGAGAEILPYGPTCRHGIKRSANVEVSGPRQPAVQPSERRQTKWRGARAEAKQSIARHQYNRYTIGEANRLPDAPAALAQGSYSHEDTGDPSIRCSPRRYLHGG